MKKSFQLLLAFAAIVSFSFVSPNHETRPLVVVIDAGHGGDDFGAKHEQHLEKDIVQKISGRIKELNKNPNIAIQFTRTGDHNMNLQERTALINQLRPDVVLSLHVSANPNPTASGMELFVAQEGKSAARSAVLAEKLKTAFENGKSLKFRGIKTAPFYILKNADAPAITVELGFITNAEDAKYLTNESQHDNIANTILTFLAGI